MKKAQISMFVIIGLILLISAGLYFYITGELTKDKPVVDVPDVSLETRPAAQLMKSCLESTAKLAIQKVSAQGGYIHPPDANLIFHRGSSIILEPNTIPFWRYIEEDDCSAQFGCSASEKPPLCKVSSRDRCDGRPVGSDSIEDAIHNYIMANIGTCINDLVSLSDFYDLEITDDRELEIFFGSGSTSFILTNTILTSSRSTTNEKTVETYRAVLDVDMLKLYDIASEVLQYIQDSNYYEYQTMNLISAYSCNKAHCLPPTDTISLTLADNVMWVQYAVKERLELEILPMMGFVNYKNFDNYVLMHRPEGEDFQGVTVDGTEYNYNAYVDGMYATFSKSFSSPTLYEGYDLNHYYLYEPIKFQIDDGKAIVKGKPIDMSRLGIINDLLSFGFSDKSFYYFISYPLVLNLVDKDAFGGEGLDFNFGIEVDVAANKPAYTNVTVVEVNSPIGLDLNSPENRVDRDITINSFNKLTDQALSDVVVKYICLDEYEMGLTKYSPTGKSTLITTLPHCHVGGYLSFSKPGYFTDAIRFNNPEGAADAELNVELWPIKKRKIEIKKRTTENLVNILIANTDGGTRAITEFSDLAVYESVMVNIRKIKESPFEESFPRPGFGMVEGEIDYENILTNQDPQSQIDIIDKMLAEGHIEPELANDLKIVIEEYTLPEINFSKLAIKNDVVIGFVPGTYELELTVIDTRGAFIPEYHTTKCGGVEIGEDLLCIGSIIPINFSEINMSTWVYVSSKVNISLDVGDVYDSDDPLTFYSLEIPKPTNWSCDYLRATFPDGPLCNTNIGFCGDYLTPNDPLRYCVQFDKLKPIEEFQLHKTFLLTEGLLSYN